MDIQEFFLDVFVPNVGLYLLSLLLLALPTYFVYKKLNSSIIDPLSFQLFMSMFANAIPIFLYLTGNCSQELFAYFLMCEFLFWLGILIFSKTKGKFKESQLKNGAQIEKKMFFYTFSMFFFLHMLIYIKFGIPLFMQNRTQTFAGSGGWGIISYIIPFLGIYILIYFVDKFVKKQLKGIFLICFVLYLMILFLGGGRGAITNLFFGYFYYTAFYLNKNPKIKWKYFLLIPMAAILTISVNLISGESPLQRFGERVVAFGDIYYFALPNNVINGIKEPNALLHMFLPILRPLRIVQYTAEESLPLGNKVLYQMNYEYELAGVTSAPNTRIPIATWIYFRWWGLLVSFIVGSTISFMLFRLRKYFHRTILGISCFSYIYYLVVAGCTDLSMFLGGFFSMALNLPILVFLLMLVSGGKLVYYKVKSNE